MNPLKFLKSYFGASGRAKAIERISHGDPTPNYSSRSTFYNSELIVNELPVFHIHTGELMQRSEPIIRFSHAVRDSTLMVAEVEIKAKNPAVKAWVARQWKTLWDNHRRELLSAKRYGFAALQIDYSCDGQLNIESVKEFHPRDVRALEHRGSAVGFTVRSNGGTGKAGGSSGAVKLFAPRGLWLTFGAEYGNPYGNGLLRRQYPPWYEKWMDRGARKLKQQRMIKDAYIGDRIYYPFNQVVEGPDGKIIPWRDIAREIGEMRMSGSLITLPMILSGDGKQKMVEYEPPADVSGGTQIFEWEEDCDHGMLLGADVPPEVVQAQENGGFSGRSIPYMVLAGNCNGEFAEIVQCVERDILRPGAWLKFGGDPEFEIKPKSLIEALATDTSGSAMGGGTLGATPSQMQRPMGQTQPGQQPQQVPAQDPRQRQNQQFSDDEPHKFSSTQFNLPSDLVPEFAAMALRIHPHDLALDGIETEPHITVKYGLHTNDEAEVRKVVEGESPVVVKLGKTSFFAGEEHDVVKVEIESDSLRALNKKITETLPHTDTFPDYKPHMTIAYVRPGLGEHYAAILGDMAGKVIVFDRLTFSNKYRFKTSILLTGENIQFDLSRDDRDDTSLAIAREALSLALPRIKTAQERIRDLLADGSIPLVTLPSIIEQEIFALERTIGQDLAAAMAAGQITGAANAITSLPDVYVPPATTVGVGSDVPPTTPPSFGSLFSPGEEPEFSIPIVDEAVEALSNARVFTSGDYRQVAEQAREGAFGITGDLTQNTVERVRNILAENIAAGADREAFTETVVQAVEGSLSEARVEQIFRTNVMSAFSDGANKALEQPMVVDAFPYRQYWATTDQRTRQTHRALERLGIQGTNIYRADDPVFRRFRPPWDFNCRCSWNPVTVEQAANQGINEAKEWLARAKAMADAKGGPWSAYLNATAPQTPAWVTPPMFEPPPEFART